jgi:glutaredoxin 3
MSQVTIYTRMMCGYSTAAKRLLERKGIDFVEHDASFSPELAPGDDPEGRRPGDLPAGLHRRNHVGGSDELHALEARGELDALLEREGIATK